MEKNIDPDARSRSPLRPWQLIVEMAGLGVVLHEVFVAPEPRYLGLLAGFILLGFVPAVKLDQVLKR